MVGEKVDVVGEQQFQPLFHPPGHHTRLTAPKQAVVNEDGIGIGMNSGFYQCTAGGDAGDDFANVRFAFNLQAVGAVIGEALGLEQAVEGGK